MLCQLVFGRTTLPDMPWIVIDPQVIALPVSIAVMVIMQWQYSRQQQLPRNP